LNRKLCSKKNKYLRLSLEMNYNPIQLLASSTCFLAKHLTFGESILFVLSIVRVAPNTCASNCILHGLHIILDVTTLFIPLAHFLHDTFLASAVTIASRYCCQSYVAYCLYCMLLSFAVLGHSFHQSLCRLLLLSVSSCCCCGCWSLLSVAVAGSYHMLQLLYVIIRFNHCC